MSNYRNLFLIPYTAIHLLSWASIHYRLPIYPC